MEMIEQFLHEDPQQIKPAGQCDRCGALVYGPGCQCIRCGGDRP